jgi:hypothetical protein
MFVFPFFVMVMKVSMLHFLVHPGHRVAYNKHSGVFFDGSEVAEDVRLCGRYRERIGSLEEEDVLVVFSPVSFGSFRGDVSDGSSWASVARYGKERLGRRCIVVSGPSFLAQSDSGKSQFVSGGSFFWG